MSELSDPAHDFIGKTIAANSVVLFMKGAGWFRSQPWIVNRRLPREPSLSPIPPDRR